MKTKWNTFVEAMGTLLVFAAPILAAGVVAFIAYQIAISDLPDWFKFWLLK